MKSRIAWFTLVLAGLGAVPASAADFGVPQESYKVLAPSGGVPVPAPVPIPEFRPAWYFRFDAGIGIISEPSVSESGFIYGEADGPGGPTTGPDPMYTEPAWLNKDFGTSATFGGGVGYYVGNGFRFDATVEARTASHVRIDGSNEWTAYAQDPATLLWAVADANGNGIPDSKTRISIQDDTRIDGTLWMLNAYYDFANYRGLTPYIGAGLGFSWNVLTRQHLDTVSTCDNEAGAGADCASGVWTTGGSTTVNQRSDSVSFAAAVAAGVSYEVSDSTALDIGYRYLWIGGTSSTMNIAGDDSEIKIGDQSIHQFRAGLRFNVN